MVESWHKSYHVCDGTKGGWEEGGIQAKSNGHIAVLATTAAAAQYPRQIAAELLHLTVFMHLLHSL